MSFDLGVWYPHKRLSNDEARNLYMRLCESDVGGVTSHPGVEAFYAELTAKHPEIDTIPEDKIDDTDYCPWSCALDHSPAHVIMPCVWSKAEYVNQLVHDLAFRHGLAVYNPQSSTITYPNGPTGKEAAGKRPEDISRENYGWLVFALVVFLPLFAKWQLGIRPFREFFGIPYWTQVLIAAIAGAIVFKLMFGKGGKTARCILFGSIAGPMYFVLLDLYLSVRQLVLVLEFALVGVVLYLPLGWCWRRLDRYGSSRTSEQQSGQSHTER